MGIFKIFGAFWALGVIIYIGFLYVLIFYIVIPGISLIAKMFGFPG